LKPGFTLKEANLGGHLAAGDRERPPRERDTAETAPRDNQIQEAVNLLKALVIFTTRQEPGGDG